MFTADGNSQPECHIVSIPGPDDFQEHVSGYIVTSVSDAVAIQFFDARSQFPRTIVTIAHIYGSFCAPGPLCAANEIRVIWIPKTVLCISSGAFQGLLNLSRVYYEKDSTLCEVDGFCVCPSLIHVFLPYSIEKIGPQGFSDCRSLFCVRFDGVTKSCPSYGQRFQCRKQFPEKIQFRRKCCRLKAISGFNQSIIKEFTVPWSVEEIDGFNGESMSSFSESGDEFPICIGTGQLVFEPNSHLRRIDGFSPPALRSIHIPDSVETIDKNAFIGDKGPGGSFCLLEEIVFDQGSQLKNVFGIRHCPRLQPVTLYGQLTVIGDDAFAFCGTCGIVVTVHGSCGRYRERIHGRTIIVNGQ
jgi:hypothetical protein